MVNIEKLTPEIIKRLKPLNPQKIILFGSYAYGIPDSESDIDLFIISDIQKEKARDLKVEAKLKLKDLIARYKIGFDIMVAPQEFVNNREDHFYKVDILQNGKVLYE
ncbi:MAG: nucleotidyltransferase domain-containing protein [Campylobacterota bacterium]